MFLYYVLIYLLKSFFYLFIFFLTVVVLSRIYFEPINATCKCKTNLRGKVALVTGGNSGIGLETARDLALRGARVIIACRYEKKAKEAIEDIARTTGNPNVEFLYLDLFKPSCIREFAKKFNESFERLDILVNNAGCSGAAHKLAENGVKLTMQVNYFGPFLLTKLLRDKLETSKPSRVVIVSSKFHIFGKVRVEDLDGVNTKSHLRKYANSKLCNILWTKALAMRLPEGVTANSLHPGFVSTNIFHRISYYRRLIEVISRVFFKAPREGAQTVIHLCVAEELERSSGGYYAECKICDCYKSAQDEELVEKVWQQSMRLAEK